MPFEFEPITASQSVAVRIAEQILGRIQRGQFPVGTKLPAEAELARQFGVSRPTVREALGALQFVGYIDSARGSGSRVVATLPNSTLATPTAIQVTAETVLELFEARLVLEPHVAAMAAQAPETEMLDQAEALIEGMGVAVTHPGLHAETDLRVHRALAGLCPNEFMRASALNLIDAAASPALASTRHQAWAKSDLPSVWGHQQEEILTAIRAGDAPAACRAAWSHLASAAENALNFLADEPTIRQASRDRLSQMLERGPTCAASVAGSPAGRPARKTGRASAVAKESVLRTSHSES